MSRGASIITWMLLAGILTIGIGSVLTALFIVPGYILNDDSGFSISDIPLLLYVTVMGSATIAFLHVSILAVLVILPVRYFWKGAFSLKTITILSALAGGTIAVTPWLIRALENMTFASGAATQGTSQQHLILPAALYFAIGCLYGGLFGFIYLTIERRGGGLSSSSVLETSDNPKKTSGTGANIVVWAMAGIIFLIVLLMIWIFTTPLRLITTARIQAVRHQDTLLHESQKMLKEAAASPNGYVSYGFPERPLPDVFKKLGGYSASTSERYPGAIKVAVTGGFTHLGLYIIPKQTSATATMLRDNKSLRAINDHLIQFSE